MSATHFSGPIALGAPSIEVLSEAQTLDPAKDNGKVFFLNNATGVTITLPPVKAGMRFKFIVDAGFATSNFVIATSDTRNIDGVLVVAGSSVQALGEDQINFVATAEGQGDWVEFIGTTTDWRITGIGHGAGSITATQS